MLLWDDEQRLALTTVIDRARHGEPTVLLVEGEAGMGKSALLDELGILAREFAVLKADGLELERIPFGALAQWNVDPPRAPDGGEPSPLVAAQALQERLDRVAAGRPVLLQLDDLHWADPESVAALLWLLRRADGDRLLAAVGSRPLGAAEYPGWQRWVKGYGRVVRVTLSGLTMANAVTLARDRQRGMSVAAARGLWEHAAGHPLYFTALLAEHDVDELAATGVLPAPVEFAANVAARTERLDDVSVALLRAAAVLGTGWLTLADAAAVARLADPVPAAQRLADSGLVRLRTAGGPACLRFAHALTHAAVYHQVALPDRCGMHTRAAAVVTTTSARWRHRLAAAQGYDDQLADQLEDYAVDCYDQRSFRQAATHLRWASSLTSDAGHRERRWLESLFHSVMAFDLPAVRAVAEDVAQAGDRSLRGLVLGALAAWERRYQDAVGWLELAGPESGDRRTDYRIAVLLGWARLCAGLPINLVAESLARAESVRTDDAALTGYQAIAANQVHTRLSGGQATVPAVLAALPDSSAAVPLRATSLLGWRGSFRVQHGLVGGAVDDLAELARRVHDGVTDFGGGGFHALLAMAHWLRGDWDSARVTSRLAFDIAGEFVHPFILALGPVVDVGEGRFTQADAMIARATENLRTAPWWLACRLVVTTRVIRAHASGSIGDQRRLLPSLRGTVLETTDTDMSGVGSLLLLHQILACVWAKELNRAEAGLVALGTAPTRAPWAPAATHWLRGLVCEARGDTRAAYAHLGSAVGDPDTDLPLYRAHMLADHARLGELLGHRSAASSLRRAEETYRRLGATPYLERLAGSRRSPGEETEPLPVAFTLTEREQDVLSLVVSGMSYAQISRELFITQSTVGYHLGNIYGKAGVGSRHKLTALARRNPRAFGLSLAGV